MNLGASGDLFLGTADYYRRYRPRYPAETFEWIVRTFKLDGTGQLLDGGCGTGEVFVPLSAWFEHVLAVDIDPDMIRLARLATEEAKLGNVELLCTSVDEALERCASLRLATFGASFHWMDRVALGNRLYEKLEPGGGLVLVAPSSIWRGDEAWKTIVRDTIQHWLGAERRAGSGTYTPGPRHEECLAQTPFPTIEIYEINHLHSWTPDSLLGYLYSTSFASGAVLGDKKGAFEADLRKRLAEVHPDGVLPDEIEVTIISAQKPVGA